MRIWIFRPHEKWQYCGGVCAAIAETLEKAGQLIFDHEYAHHVKQFPNLTFRMEFLAWDCKEEKTSDVWVLDCSVGVVDEIPRFIIASYNDS